MARSVPAEKNPHGLTDQQFRFCQEYAKSLDASQAYRAAGYKNSTDRSTWANASRLLKSDKVRAYLDEVLNLTAVNVIHNVAAIALSDITDVLTWDEDGVDLIPSDRISARGKGSIKTLKCKKRTITRRVDDATETEVIVEYEVGLYDRLAALEKLMRKLGLYPQSVQALLEGMATQGLLVPGQAEAIASGIENIEEKLRSLPAGTPTGTGDD